MLSETEYLLANTCSNAGPLLVQRHRQCADIAPAFILASFLHLAAIRNGER